MWSKWQWVMRIATAVAPISSSLARIRSASSPGSTTRTRSEPSRRTRKQFSATGPTVSISTSRAMRRRSALLAGPHPGPLAFPPHHLVDVIAGRDVEDEHEGAQGEGGADRPPEEEQEQGEEDRRGDEPAEDRAAPGRRRVVARCGCAAASRASLRFRLLAAARAGAAFGVDAA